MSDENKPKKRVHFSCKRKVLSDGTIQKYCQCDGCFSITSVNVIKIPLTKYWNKKTLSTKYTERWYCDECIGKLYKAIRDNRIEYIFDNGLWK